MTSVDVRGQNRFQQAAEDFVGPASFLEHAMASPTRFEPAQTDHGKRYAVISSAEFMRFTLYDQGLRSSAHLEAIGQAQSADAVAWILLQAE